MAHTSQAIALSRPVYHPLRIAPLAGLVKWFMSFDARQRQAHALREMPEYLRKDLGLSSSDAFCEARRLGW